MSDDRLGGKAAEDLSATADHTIEKFGPKQARAYRDRLARTCSIIGENPDIGRLVETINPAVRFFPCGSHIIVYLVEDGAPLILRIRHAREEWKDDPAGE